MKHIPHWQAVIISVAAFAATIASALVGWPVQFTIAGFIFVLSGAYFGKNSKNSFYINTAIILAPWTILYYNVIYYRLVHMAPLCFVIPLSFAAGVWVVRSSTHKMAVSMGLAVIFVVGGTVGMPNWLTYVFNRNVGEVRLNESAPAISLVDGSGASATIDEWIGKTVILDFWTTDCGVCYAKFPETDEFYQDVRSDSLVMYAVHLSRRGLDKEVERSRGLERYRAGGYQMPVLLSESTFREVSEAYGFRGTPAIAVIDAEGTVKYVGNPQLGALGFVDNLKRIVEGVQ